MQRGAMERLGVGVTVGGALAVTGAAFLPWLRSGQVLRDSFEVVRVADHLDLAAGIGQDIAIGLWYLLPALCAVVVLAAVLHRLTLMVILATVAGGLALVAGVMTINAPFPTEWGAWTAVLAALVTLTGASLTWWAGRGAAGTPSLP